MSKENHFDQVVRVPLPNNRVVICRIELGANIVVGPGPKPTSGGTILAHRIDDHSVLTIDVAVGKAETANISVGPGPKPT